MCGDFYVLTASWCTFLYLSKLELLFVYNCLTKFLELCSFAYILTFSASMVANLTYSRNNASALHTLSEAPDDVCTTFVLILFYFNVYCHMWAKEYHLGDTYASVRAFATIITKQLVLSV